MKFKQVQDKIDWEGRRPCPPALRLFIDALDLYRIAALDSNEITITSFWRDKGVRFSYHPKGHAVDIRTHDMKPLIEHLFLSYTKALRDLFNEGELSRLRMRIDVVGHEELRGTPDAHIHIEQDDNSPVKL